MTPDKRVGDFSFSVELRGERPVCVAAGDRWFPLATALSSAWGLDGSLLAGLLERRAGWSQEGAVGFHYSGDGPDEAPDGKVRVIFMEERLACDQAFFEEAAIAFALAAIELMQEAGRPVADGLDARFRALRGGSE